MNHKENKMKKIGILAALFVLLLQSLAAQRQDTLFVLHTSDTHSRIEPISQRSADRNAGLGAWCVACRS